MSATEYLRAQCQENWDIATKHAFCRELSDGTLPLDKMKWYLAQDYKFIDGFVRLLSTAVAHAPTLADSVPAAQFLAVITGPENTYFLRAFDALDMSDEERNPPADPATVAFQNLMHKARMSGRYELMLAVLVVAEWSYLSWAEPFVDYDKNLPFWFSEWIDLHAGPGFTSVVNYLRDQLDKAWGNLSESERATVTEFFTNAVSYECDFFNAAYANRR